MKKATVSRMELPRGRRVLAVSDVHADLPLFRALLQKAEFCPQDILFIVGDLLEKGRDSLDILRYVMALAKTHTVHVVNGNCDDLVTGFVDGREELTDGFFRYYIDAFGERCTMVQMGRKVGLSDADMADYPKFRAALRKRFQAEFDFLRGWPTMIDTQKYLFVHGGIASDRDMEQYDAWRCMKNDNFAQQESALSKWTVVGHTPTTLYRPQIPSANPYISPEKKLISIDGGCSIKPDGQLNLLVLEDGYAEGFSFLAADMLAVVTALDEQKPSADSVNIRWGKNALELLERGEEFSRCRHLDTGRVVEILNEYLYEGNDGILRCEDSTDYELEVHPGDALSLVRRTSKGQLVKRNGVTGWYRGETT